jgi:hypothetical protein
MKLNSNLNEGFLELLCSNLCFLNTIFAAELNFKSIDESSNGGLEKSIPKNQI